MPLTPNDNLPFLRRCFRRLVMLTMLLQASSALAGDWPQILGPNRNGIAADDEQLIAWPSDGPKEVWTADVGQGFAGVAVRGDTVILFHRTDEREVVEARSATTGRQQWAQPAAVDYRSGMSSDSGPRCVPLIHEDRILVFGIAGQLRCLAWNDGSEIWSRDTWKDFGAPEGYFGAGSSPLVIGDVVVVNVGGRAGAAVVGFDLKTGRTLWSSFDDTASYSSPIAITPNDRTQAVVITRLHTLFLNPADGDVIDSFPFGARGPTVNGASPVWIDDHIFVSSSYRVGSVLADCRGDSVKAAELGEDLLATQYATPVRHGILLYAVDGRQDIGSATVKCIDPLNKETLWQQPGFDYGTLLRVRDELIFLTCGGELIRFAADDTGYKESNRSTVLEATPRGYRLPALSNGRLYIRDDQQLKCLQVGLSKSVQ
ncbi:MAG: PQQ-like beta-propeller repeat protein [Fuerstiella sp.]